MDCVEEDLLRSIRDYGFFVIPGKLSDKQVARCIDEIRALPKRTTYLSLRDQSEKWSEITLSEQSFTAGLILNQGLKEAIEETFLAIQSIHYWANE